MSVAFPYTNNKLSVKKKKMKKTIPYTIASKIMLRNKFNQGDERSLH